MTTLRPKGDDRDALRAVVARRYEEGVSVRVLAKELGCSYGLVHRLLGEAGVTMRPRGASVVVR